MNKNDEPRRIKADGKLSARIALIGEAGGKDERIKLRPFVGWSGRLLSQWWAGVGLSRKDFWIDNVYPFTPPMRGGYPQLSMVHPDDLKFWMADLHDRLAKLPNLNVIVPVGDLALKALTGMKGGITRYRGSILTYNDKIKVIPTIHPAATARRPIWAKACVVDWARIADEARTPEISLPKREHFTRPTTSDLEWFKEQIDEETKRNSVLAIDCEWVPDKHSCQLLCVGFALDPGFSFTVPTTLEYWRTKDSLRKALAFVKDVCESEIPKVLHHGNSDAYVLKRLEDIDLREYEWDTLAMHHALDANSDHDLAYLASIYTKQPYWKDEAKDPEKIAKYASNFDALLTYNGIDVAVTRELFDVLHEELRREDKLNFYHGHYAALFDPMIDMMLTGIAVDSKTRKRRQAQLQAEIVVIQDKISEIVGEQCFAKKGLKNAVLMRYFHDDLGLKKVMRTRKKKGGEKVKTASLDEVVIRRYMIEYESAREIGQLVLDHRRKYVLMNQYGEGRVDDDGRMRSTYGPYADTGRFRSSESPLGTGSNGQNVDRETRDCYVPDAF